MHYSDKNYNGIVELIVYWSEGEGTPQITQIWSANHAQPYALQKLLSTFEFITPLKQLLDIGYDEFIKVVYVFNKDDYRYQFERVEEINNYQKEYYYLH